MYNIPTYDHSKPEVRDTSGPSFFHRAAQISIWAPILAVLFEKGTENAIDGQHGQWVIILSLVATGLVVFAFVASIVLGIIALCGMSTHGTEGILTKSLCGIILSIGLLAIFSSNFIRGFEQGWKKSRENRATLERLEETTREVTAQQKSESNRSHKLTAESAQPQFDKLKSTLDEAAANGSPELAIAAKATRSFMDKIQTATIEYATAEKGLLKPIPVFDMSNVQQREQLQAKRKLVNNFMAENKNLLLLANNAETMYRAELTKFQVPTATAESALAAFHTKALQRTPIEINIRKSDERIGTALLTMLDLLDKNWGTWTYDGIKKKPIFTTADAQQKYDGCFKEIRSAAADQKKFQAQLVNLPDVAANR